MLPALPPTADEWHGSVGPLCANGDLMHCKQTAVGIARRSAGLTVNTDRLPGSVTPRPSCARACRRVRMRSTPAISPRGKAACDEIMQKDAAGDDRGPERHLVVESL